MERDTFKPDNPEDRYLNRQAELLWGLTFEALRQGEGTELITRGLRLICFGAYRYMRDHGRQDWADEILRMAQISHHTRLQDIQGQKVADAAH